MDQHPSPIARLSRELGDSGTKEILPPTERNLTMPGKLTKAQRVLLQHIADHSGRLYGTGQREFPRSVMSRRDVLDRLQFGRLVYPPRVTATRTWELTDAGRAALQPKDPTNAQ